MSATLYTVKYNEKYRESFNDDSLFVTFEPNYRYHAIVKEETVSHRIIFVSSFMGWINYELIPEHPQVMRIEYQNAVPEYGDGTRWNYTAEEFQREITDQLHHVWTFGGEPLPPEIFEIFQKMVPEAINGRAHYTK